MKKIVFTWLLVIILLLGHGMFKYNTGGVWYGMDWDDITELVPEREYHNNYHSWINNAGNIVIVNCGASTIRSIRVIDASFCNPSEFRFGLIRDGMSQYQVTALVGIPTSKTYGRNRSTYITNEGTFASHIWRESDSHTGEYVVHGNAVIHDPSEDELGYYQNSSNPYVRHFPTLQLVPWLHNLLDGAIVWAAILYTEKLRMQKKKTAEAQ